MEKLRLVVFHIWQSPSESNMYLVCKTIEEIRNDIQREKYLGHAKKIVTCIIIPIEI
jgi:hypothetical protein